MSQIKCPERLLFVWYMLPFLFIVTLTATLINQHLLSIDCSRGATAVCCSCARLAMQTHQRKSTGIEGRRLAPREWFTLESFIIHPHWATHVGSHSDSHSRLAEVPRVQQKAMEVHCGPQCEAVSTSERMPCNRRVNLLTRAMSISRCFEVELK